MIFPPSAASITRVKDRGQGRFKRDTANIHVNHRGQTRPSVPSKSSSASRWRAVLVLVLGSSRWAGLSQNPLNIEYSGGCAVRSHSLRTDKTFSCVMRSASAECSRNGLTSALTFAQLIAFIRSTIKRRQLSTVTTGPFHPVCARAEFNKAKFGAGHDRSAKYQTRSYTSRPLV